MDPTAAAHAVDLLYRKGDRLFRASSECCRQRQRYASLVAGGVGEMEQRAALRIACLCDEVLVEAIAAYEKAAANAKQHGDDQWWHKANALWMAAREYVRHHQYCDEAARQFTDHSPEAFGELAMEFDLEASALLGLQHAIDAYRKARPSAELKLGNRQVA